MHLISQYSQQKQKTHLGVQKNIVGSLNNSMDLSAPIARFPTMLYRRSNLHNVCKLHDYDFIRATLSSGSGRYFRCTEGCSSLGCRIVECDAKLRAQSWCTRLWQWWSGGWWCRVGGDAAISQMHFAASPSMSASSNASTDCVRAARHTLFWILGEILGQFFPHVKKHFTLDHPKCSGKNNGRQGKFVLRQINWARLSALVRVPNSRGSEVGN